MHLWACVSEHQAELCLLQGRCGHRSSRSGCMSWLHAALHTVPELKVLHVQRQTLQTWAQACKGWRTSGMLPQHMQLLPRLMHIRCCCLQSERHAATVCAAIADSEHMHMRRCCLQSQRHWCMCGAACAGPPQPSGGCLRAWGQPSTGEQAVGIVIMGHLAATLHGTQKAQISA